MTAEELTAKIEALERELAAMRAEAESASRRAKLALGYVKEALKYGASTPRVGAMLRDIEKELKKRLQELDCLYRTSSEIESDNDLVTALRNITTHLVAGLKVPENAGSSAGRDC